MTSLTVGIEGPVLAGKSTVVTAMKERLCRHGIPSVAVPCFVEAAIKRGVPLPRVVPMDAASQVAAVQFYLAIDQWRRPASPEGVVLLDRTCWTLMAHTASLAAMGLVDAVIEVKQSVNESHLSPRVVIYLDVSHAQQLSRARGRGELPVPLLDPAFNVQFRTFFQTTQAEHRAHWVNADQPIPQILNEVEAHILQKCVV
jgi:thymidylate kinase